MKKITVLLTAILAVAVLAGCAQTESSVNPIGFDAAKQAALTAAGVDAGAATFEENELKEYNGQQYYDIDFYANGREYEYRIDALTGAVIAPAPGSGQPQVAESNVSGTPSAPQTGEQTEKIGEEKAKEIALNHAGVKAADVTFVKAGLDHDDGRQMYDIEFYTADYREFDYDIDVFSGEILSFDHDAEYYTLPENVTLDGTITEAEAKALALAQVPGATEADIREFEIDGEHGRLEYEGSIYYGELEYEFEIDGHSGAIRSWEVESIYD